MSSNKTTPPAISICFLITCLLYAVYEVCKQFLRGRLAEALESNAHCTYTQIQELLRMKISKLYKNVLRSAIGLLLVPLSLAVIPSGVSYAADATAPICGTNNTFSPTIDPNTGEVTATGRCRGATLMCTDASNKPIPCTDTATTCKG